MMKNGIKILLLLCMIGFFAGMDRRAEAAGTEVLSFYGDGEAAGAKTSSFYEDGDIVGFIGDSITHATYISYAYPEILYQYYLSRFPGRSVEFRNLSAGGFKARDILDIYDRDPAFRGLTKAVILLGTNNAILKESAEEYIAEMERLVNRLKEDGLGGEDILIVSPPICDENYSKNFDKNGRKRWAYEDRVLEYMDALEAKIPEWGVNFVDIHTAMVELTAEIQAEGNSLTTDCIHPNTRGQFLIAALILQAQGANGEALSGIFVQEDGEPRTLGGVLTDYYRGERGLCLTWIPETLPVAATDGLIKFRQFYEPARALYREPLQVEGLSEETSYRILMGEMEIGNFTGEELEQGIDLAVLESHPLQETMRWMEEMERKRHQNAVEYRNLWIEVGMQRADPTAEQVQAEYEKWRSEDERLRGEIYGMAQDIAGGTVRLYVVEEGYSAEELEQDAERAAREVQLAREEQTRREAEEQAAREAEERRLRREAAGRKYSCIMRKSKAYNREWKLQKNR